jgi:putative alpha-1,2-mannosidase
MGDYQQFNMMPQLANDLNYSANCDVNTRGIPFSHDNEIARPDYYSVSMDNNIRVSITPSSHSAIYQFNFPQTSEFGSLIFDSRNGSDNNSDQFEFGAGGVRENAAAFSGFVDNKGGLSNGSTRMFIYGEFSSGDYNVVNSTPTSSNPRKNINFKLDESKTVTVKIATSYIGTEQAKRNLHQEILDDNLNFNSLHKQATAKWQNRFGAINLHGSNATDTQKVTMYSNLYRLNLYPNAYFENTGTTQIPNYKHASPVLPTIGEITPDNTNAQICPGKMYVNNGF